MTQLREKQKARRIYGVLESQFSRYYEQANSSEGITGETLLLSLETRLDNIVFRAGWGASRSQARQFVRHGLILVNGKRVTIPSYRIKKGDEITLIERARTFAVVEHNLSVLQRAVPPWLERTDDSFAIKVNSLPLRAHIDIPVREQLIVELYSK
jgi:small subunit ribosomal protein S4